MINARIFPLPGPTSCHVIPAGWSPALHTGCAVLDIRLVLTHRVAMAQISVSDTFLSRPLTPKVVVVVPAVSMAGLSVLVNNLARTTVNTTHLQGAVLAWGNTAQPFLEVPVVIGDGLVTTVTLVLLFYTDLTTLVLRPGTTLLPTPVIGNHNPQHYRGLSNTAHYFSRAGI